MCETYVNIKFLCWCSRHTFNLVKLGERFITRSKAINCRIFIHIYIYRDIHTGWNLSDDCTEFTFSLNIPCSLQQLIRLFLDHIISLSMKRLYFGQKTKYTPQIYPTNIPLQIYPSNIPLKYTPQIYPSNTPLIYPP